MPDDYVARTVQAYDAHAEQYEVSTAAYAAPELDDFIKQLPHSKKIVLDVGCASGRDTAIMAEAGVNVVGIDMSEKLLERARINVPSVEFHQMDMRELDLSMRAAGLYGAVRRCCI